MTTKECWVSTRNKEALIFNRMQGFWKLWRMVVIWNFSPCTTLLIPDSGTRSTSKRHSVVVGRSLKEKPREHEHRTITLTNQLGCLFLKPWNQTLAPSLTSKPSWLQLTSIGWNFIPTTVVCFRARQSRVQQLRWFPKHKNRPAEFPIGGDCFCDWGGKLDVSWLLFRGKTWEQPPALINRASVRRVAASRVLHTGHTDRRLTSLESFQTIMQLQRRHIWCRYGNKCEKTVLRWKIFVYITNRLAKALFTLHSKSPNWKQTTKSNYSVLLVKFVPSGFCQILHLLW